MKVQEDNGGVKIEMEKETKAKKQKVRHNLQKEQSSEVKQKVYCNCKKTKCLKLYCDCFRLNQTCDGCNCQGCHNLEIYND